MGRTLISGLGSTFWESRNTLEFLQKLRLMTPVNSVVLVSMPKHMVEKRHRRYFDACISLTSLVASIKPSTEEFIASSVKKMGYHGLIKVTKCNSAQCLNPYKPDSNDL